MRSSLGLRMPGIWTILRKTQTQLDLYIGSVYGKSGLDLTMRLRTFQTFNDEAPLMDIELVMEPPLPE